MATDNKTHGVWLINNLNSGVINTTDPKQAERFSVWLTDGDEVNDYYVTYEEALEIQQAWADRGYTTIIWERED
jgi:hypothetical protein